MEETSIRLASKDGGKTVSVPARIHSRGGTRSPELIMVLLAGRWVAPKRWLMNWDVSPTWFMNRAFKRLYPTNLLKDLIYAKNPFFSFVPKDEGFTGKYIPIPLGNKFRIS